MTFSRRASWPRRPARLVTHRPALLYLVMMATRTSKPKGKKVITPAFKREIEKARRDLANGKGISVGELLTRALERGARGHAA
jgi:hypothetical protein